jgi:hypothetical protein
MPGPLFVDVLQHTDTELGSMLRDAHANGVNVVVLLTWPARCPTCLREMVAEANCVACGDDFAAERAAVRDAVERGATDIRVVPGTTVPDPDDLPM